MKDRIQNILGCLFLPVYFLGMLLCFWLLIGVTAAESDNKFPRLPADGMSASVQLASPKSSINQTNSMIIVVTNNSADVFQEVCVNLPDNFGQGFIIDYSAQDGSIAVARRGSARQKCSADFMLGRDYLALPGVKPEESKRYVIPLTANQPGDYTYDVHVVALAKYPHPGWISPLHVLLNRQKYQVGYEGQVVAIVSPK